MKVHSQVEETETPPSFEEEAAALKAIIGNPEHDLAPYLILKRADRARQGLNGPDPFFLKLKRMVEERKCKDVTS